MKVKKIFEETSILVVILLVLGLFAFNMSNGWTYVKVNGNLYVANSNGVEEYPIKEKVGSVNQRVFNILKPLKNDQSNGFPNGTELYSDDNTSRVIAKFNDKYYILEDINKAENWGNGLKMKIKNNTIVDE